MFELYNFSNLHKSLKQKINAILNELKGFENNNVHEYKTLTDSLTMLIKTVRNNTKNREDVYTFLNVIKVDIEKEIKRISDNVDSLLANKKYKEYRNWLISLDRLLSIRTDIVYECSAFEATQDKSRK